MQLLLAILLLASSQLATQMLLPALPDIASHFRLNESDAQQIVMLYFVSFGLSQLFYGPWIDSVGRRKVFYTGLGVFLLGSLLCYFATSASMFAAGRILQGLGAGSPLILSRVIFSGIMQGDALKKAYGSLAIAASITSFMAPLMGGWLTTTFEWHSVLLVFNLHLLLTLIAGFLLLPPDIQVQRKLTLRGSIRDYGYLLSQRRFITAGSFKWLPTLMFLSMSTLLPFEMQHRFGLSPEQYGRYMSICFLGLVLGSTLSKVIQQYCTAEMIIALFWPLLIASGLIFVFHSTSLMAILVAIGLFMMAGGTYYSSCLHLIMDPFKEKGGTASALVGAIDMFVFSTLAVLANRYWVTDMKSLGELFLLCSVFIAINWVILWFELIPRVLTENPTSASNRE